MFTHQANPAPVTAGKGMLQLFAKPENDGPPVRRPEVVIPTAQQFDEQYYFFCQRDIPIREATKGGLVVGANGSGKTACVFRPLLQSIVERVRENCGRGERIIIFDAKGDVLAFLASLGFTPEDGSVQILNAFDKRGVRWHIAESLQEPARAWDFCSKLVPEEKNSTAPFFSDAARLLAFAVILALNAKHGTNWMFRDLLCALESKEIISEIAAQCPQANAIARGILCDEKHSPSVIASLQTKIRKFSQVAALWANNKEAPKFSIQEFLKTPGILVIGFDHVMKESWVPLIELFLRCYADEVLAGPETLDPTNHFLLDEFTTMGKFDKEKTIVDLLELGRSKGVCCTLGIQSIAALIEIYTEPGANRILSLCAHKMFLRVGDPQSGEWIEKFVGKRRMTETTYSESWGKNGSSTSIQYAVQDRSLLLASVFMNIPFPGPGKEFSVICDVPSEHAMILTSRSFDQILSWAPPAVAFEAVQRQTGIKEQTLLPWDEIDKAKFLKPALEQGSNPTHGKEKPVKNNYLPSRKKRSPTIQTKDTFSE